LSLQAAASCGGFANTSYFVDIVFTPNHGVNLAWTASSGATSYGISRAPFDGSSCSTSNYSPIKSVSTTNYSDQPLASGSYCYKVDATNSGATSGSTSPVEATVQ
jgi:hypothetical protein